MRTTKKKKNKSKYIFETQKRLRILFVDKWLSLCVFARRTKCSHSFSFGSGSGIKMSVREIGWCRLVDGHLANEGNFSVHVFFYSWLMPSKNRKSRHFPPRWLVDDDDSWSALVYDVLFVANRFVGIRRGWEGETTWSAYVSHTESNKWRRFVLRFFVRRKYTSSGYFV